MLLIHNNDNGNDINDNGNDCNNNYSNEDINYEGIMIGSEMSEGIHRIEFYMEE